MSDRHQFRADWHDYNKGMYFVTICCAERACLFGFITENKMNLSDIGRIADMQCRQLSDLMSDVDVLNYVIMPNHLHLVLSISDVGTLLKASTQANDINYGCLKAKRHNPPQSQDFHHNSRLSVVIRCLKGGVSREAHRSGFCFSWQKGFHEHIIRNQIAFDNIMNYIDTNVEKWIDDCFNK